MAKVKRNAPCPCGSGKKYKKCCLAKDEALAAEAAKQSQEPAGIDRVASHLNEERRGPRMHPYVIARALEDSDVMGRVKKRGRRKKRPLWTLSKVAAMETEEIEQRLSDLGLEASRDRFLESARGHTSAWELSRLWVRQVSPSGLSGADDDFLGLAACELWKRHCPERPSIEMLDDWMQEGYVHMQELRDREACEKWWELWQVLSQRLTPEMSSPEHADGLIAGTQIIDNWIQDFTDSLHNAAVNDQRCAQMGLDFFRQLREKLPDEYARSPLLYRTETAQMYYRLDREDEGERLLLEIIEEHPDKAAGYVCLADELSFESRDGDRPPDLERAVALLETARDRPVVDAEHWDLDARIEHYRSQIDAASTS